MDEPTLQNQLLTQEVEGNAPAFTPQENSVGKALQPLVNVAGPVSADPKTEYVSGGWWGPLGSYLQGLEPWIDDLTRDFGADLYERMGRDPHLFGETLVYKSSVLSSGVRLLPAIDGDEVDESADGYRSAKRVRDFCKSGLAEIDTPLMPLLREMLDAYGQGHRVAEVVYRQDKQWLIPWRIKPKPRESVAFVVDSRRNVQGLLGALAGRETYAMNMTQLVDPATTYNILPRAKFAVLTWDSLMDPRGKSMYRAAYDPWWLKQQTLAELQKFLAQAAGERLVGYTAEGAKVMPAYNPDGTPMIVDGLPVNVSPEQAMLSQILNLRSGAAGAFPFGSKVEALASSTEGQAIFNALDYYDRQMSKALLGQTLATNEGQHQARASSETAKSVMDLVTEYGEELLCNMIRRDILKVMVAINLGPKALRYLPLVSMSAVEETDITKVGTVAGQLFTAGYLADNQLAAMDSKLGLPAAEGERGTYQKAMEAQKALEAQGAMDAKPDPATKPDPQAQENAP